MTKACWLHKSHQKQLGARRTAELQEWLDKVLNVAFTYIPGTAERWRSGPFYNPDVEARLMEIARDEMATRNEDHVETLEKTEEAQTKERNSPHS